MFDKVKAPLLDNIKWNSLSRDGVICDDETMKIVNRIFEKLKIFDNKNKNEKDDWYYFLYYEAKRGSIEDYADYKEYLEEGYVKNYQEFKKDWLFNYPKETYWYKLEFRKVINDDKTFVMMGINQHTFLNIDPINGKGWKYDCTEIVGVIEEIVDEVISKIKTDEYIPYLKAHFPYTMRKGIISIKDFWNLYPDIKEEYFNDLKQYDLNQFIKFIQEDNLKEKATIFKHFTAKKYYDICALGYRALGFDSESKLSNKELFYKKSDGRVQGLDDIDMNSETEFDDWYNEHKHGFDHTFEILPGRSFYRGHLYIAKKDEGYYLLLGGNNYFTAKQIIVFYMELRKNGIIPYLYDSELIVGRLEESVDIAVLPEYEDTYGYSYVFGKTYIDAINIDDDKTDEFIKKVKWEDIILPILK